jgi:hypothetical protein
MVNWLSNFYYLVATIFDDTWRAFKRFSIDWQRSHYR